MSVVSEGKTGQYPLDHQVAFVRETIYSSRPRRSVLRDRDRRFRSFSSCRTLDSGKASAITAATDTKFLTAAFVSRGAYAACGGFGCARNTATTFHVFCRL